MLADKVAPSGAAKTSKQDTKDAAVAGSSAQSLDDETGAAAAATAAAVAAAPPAAVLPAPAGPAPQEQPVRNLGAEKLAAVAAATEAIKLKDDADSPAATGSKKANQEEPCGAGGAGGAGNGKRPSAAPKSRAPTDMGKEQALAEQILQYLFTSGQLRCNITTDPSGIRGASGESSLRGPCFSCLL